MRGILADINVEGIMVHLGLLSQAALNSFGVA